MLRNTLIAIYILIVLGISAVARATVPTNLTSSKVLIGDVKLK